MKSVETVGDLRRAIYGLDDEVPLSIVRSSFAADPGLYVMRFADGTYSPARVELHHVPPRIGTGIFSPGTSVTYGNNLVQP